MFVILSVAHSIALDEWIFSVVRKNSPESLGTQTYQISSLRKCIAVLKTKQEKQKKLSEGLLEKCKQAAAAYNKKL